MSVIVALISTRDGVVASDGRHFGSALLANGKVVQRAVITSEEFDKTFSLNRGKLIGAFTGLMSFSGKSIGQHILEIIDNSDNSPVGKNKFSTITARIEQEMKTKLGQIDNQEVIFACRKLDILLVGSETLTRYEQRIAAISFFPDNGSIVSKKEIVAAKQFNQYYVYGEEKARTAATQVFRSNSAPNRDSKFLRNLAIGAVKAGIRAAGTHPYGLEPACGGKVFTKRLGRNVPPPRDAVLELQENFNHLQHTRESISGGGHTKSSSVTGRPELPEVRRRIAALRRIDLTTVDLSFLVERIHLLFHGFAVSVPILEPGQKIFRAVKWDEKHLTVDWLKYPPSDKVTKYGRVNRPEQSMFYGSVGWNAPLFELQLKRGDHIGLSRWRLTERLIVNTVGYTDRVFQRLQSDRNSTPTWERRDQVTQTPVNRALQKFFSAEFARDVPADQEHQYKISVAIAEILLRDMDEDGRIESVSDTRMAGLVYPALAMLGHSDNLVLKPDIVDRYLQLEQVEYMRIDSMDVDGKFVTYHNTHLDFADTFKPDGSIEWKGRPARWHIVIPPGGMVRWAIENGRQVYRNENGDLIEPI